MTTVRMTLTICRSPWPIRALRWLRNPRGDWANMTSLPWQLQLFALLVPYRLRRIHERYAQTHGYFWLPCPLCGKPFGGHEWRRAAGRPDSVPNPMEPTQYVGICPRCTVAGRGVRE